MRKKIMFSFYILFLCWFGCTCQVFGEENDTLTVEIHYIRYNEDYDGWNLWLWTDQQAGQSYAFSSDEIGMQAEITLEQTSGESLIGLIIRKGEWEEKDVDEDRFLDISKAENGRLTVFFWQGEETVYYEWEEAKTRILDTCLESETEVTFQVFGKAGESFKVVDQDGNEYPWSRRELNVNGNLLSGRLILRKEVSLPNTYYLVVGDVKKSIRFGGIYDTETFQENFVYNGNDLGAVCNEKESRFCLWSPMAKEAALLLYEEGDGGEPVKTVPLSREEKGIWRLTVEGDYRNWYYTYLVNVQGYEWEVVDPYARSTGVNGERGMLLSAEEGMPEGFHKDTFLQNAAREDVILYEMSVRDYTKGEASGVVQKGKFLGLTEEGTVNPAGDSTGLTYLTELGITHVHLLPIQEFYGVDERNTGEEYNWGYNPMSYFVPEGSYSTDPYHGEVRVRECREMIQSFHNHNIGVVMDVVYNHTYQNANSNLNRIVPGYYYRIREGGSFSNGSGCGNELATERAMVRKYIIDSVKYWMREYHVDGFRFDLMGLMDVETMQEIEKEVYRINPHAVLYGEGWDAGETMYEGDRMESVNAYLAPQIGVFNNVFRRAVQKYVCGFVEEEATVLGMEYGFAGAGDCPDTIERMGKWTANPLQCINYATCHDGYTLWDLITLSCPDEDEEMWKQRDRFGAACVLLCQGTPFLHSGEEIIRTKASESNPEVKYSASYNLGDYVNAIDWENRTENKDVLAYYKGLISFRKEHDGLKYKTQEQLNENLVFIEGLPENVMGYYARESVNPFVERRICLLFNPALETVEYTPVYGAWEIYINAEQAGTECIETVPAGEPLRVAGASALAAVTTVVRKDRIIMAIVLVLAAVGIPGWVIRRNKRKRV